MKRLYNFYSFILFFFCLTISTYTLAQSPKSLEGKVIDGQTNEPLVSANIVMRFAGDTSKFVFATTDLEGKFDFKNLTQPAYLLQISYVGYQKYEQSVSISEAKTVLEPIKMKVNQLSQVVIEGRQIVSEQIGDTIQYNAGAFKTERNADAETLIKKMPTITTENGELNAQGEKVQQVLVDGKPFFGNDPNAALKNLPAEVISKVQVFDQASDQEQFTGIKDGNTVKTINIITKKDRRNGQFGKVYGGYGTDNRYISGGNLNFFNGDQRISVVGLSNNVSQQNFSSQDLTGITGGAQRRRRWRRDNGDPNEAGNFLVGSQNGITQTTSFGINYNDDWGEKIAFSGSYFYNTSENEALQDLNRLFFLEGIQNQEYEENEDNLNQNQNHRFAGRVEYKMDKSNELILSPRLSIQQVDNRSQTEAATFLDENTLLNSTSNTFNNNTTALNFQNDALYRLKFKKRRRTFSVNLNTQYSMQDGENTLLGTTQNIKATDTLNQVTFDNNNDLLWALRFNYTEPLTKKSSLQARYTYSNNQLQNDRETFELFSDEQVINPLLSSLLESDYIFHDTRFTYSYRTKKLILNTSLTYQYATLRGGQEFPFETNFNRDFQNLMPRLFARYSFSKNSSLRLIYFMRTRAPQISQLQEVLDNSNPVQLSIGNEELDQQLDSRYILRYSYNNPDKRINFFSYIYARQSQGNISNATWIAQNDSLIVDGILLEQGTQLTRPINVDGVWNTRLFATVGIPLWKLNLNWNNRFSYDRTPTFINDRENIANNYGIQQGLSVNSNISEKIDFNLGYDFNYNIVENTIQPQADNNFIIHEIEFDNTFLFGKGFLWQNDVSYQRFSGLDDGFNQDFLLWSMSLGKRFLKDERGELKLTVFDLFNQNNSISRNVTETFVEDVQTNVLQQYFLVSFTYMIRNFRTKADKEQEQNRNSRGRGRGGYGGR